MIEEHGLQLPVGADTLHSIAAQNLRHARAASAARPIDPAAQVAVPQAGPRPLRSMSYNIKHGQTNASCSQPPRIPGQPPLPEL
jgi:hypothetical protein